MLQTTKKLAGLLAVSLTFISAPAFADWDYDYYEFSGSWTQLPDFSTLTPVASGTSPTIGVDLRLRNDQFAFRFTNQLDVTVAGNYEFSTNSDDGSELWIDGAMVVDNDGLHGPTTVTASVFLNVGTHSFEVTMFEQGGGEVLEAQYAPPGGGFRPFPASGALDGPPDLSVVGSWGAVIPWPHVPVSAANLPDGRILTWASNERYSFPGGRPEFTFTGIWDPVAGSILEVDHPTHDMFCAHQVMLEDGKVFVSGGRNSENSPWTSVFDLATDSWVPLNNMNRGRWYPTSVALSDGSIFTAIGRGGGNTGEKYDPSTGTWSLMNGLDFNPMVLDYPSSQYNERDWWPLFNLAPDGRIFHAGPTPQMHWIDTAASGTATEVLPEFTDWYPKHGTTVMYDEGKMLTAGGWVNGNTLASTNEAHTIDLNQPVPDIQATQPMVYPRKFHNGVMLPNGEVLVIGGNTSGQKFNDTGTVYAAEIWNPTTGQWRVAAPMSVPRNYHSIALMLTDGTVLSAGGGLCNCAADHPDGQVFYPPYLYNPDGTLRARPSITSAPAAIRAGDQFSVETDEAITHFSLIKMSSTTHAVNTDLRYIPLPFTGGAGNIYELTAHANPNVLTPGYWMLFALNAAGTPSVSHVLHVRSANDGDPTPVVSTELDFASFADVSAFQLNGDAASVGGDLRLTDTTVDQVGTAFYRTPMSIDTTTSFSTSFGFAIEGGAAGSEGLAFVMQGNENTEVGAGGSGLGYQFIVNSLVVEFDTATSAGESDNNHVAVHTGGDATTALASAVAPFNLNDGALHRAWVDYSSLTDTLDVYLVQNPTDPKPLTPLLSIADFRLFDAVGSIGYVGFSGATGAGTPNRHEIDSWEFSLAVGDTPLLLTQLSSTPQSNGSSVSVTAEATGDGLEYSWVWGDGSPPTAWSSSEVGSHNYAQPGRYVVSVTVRDIHGAEQTSQFTLAVYPPLTANAPAASTTLIVESVTGVERAWVVNPDNNSVTVINGETQTKVAEIPVGADPRALALAPDNTVWVVNKDAATVSIIDVTTLGATGVRTLPAGSRPHGVVIDWVAGTAFVALEATGEVTKLDLYSNTVLATADVGPNPRHLSLTGDGNQLFVSRFITPPLPGEATTSPQTSDGSGDRGGEVLVLNPSTLAVGSTVVLAHNNNQPAEITGPGFPNYLGPAIISPAGTQAYVPSKQDNILRGSSRNGLPLNHDHSVRAVTSIIDVAGASEIANRIDHDNASIARNGSFDPFGIYLFVALEGNREVAIVDAWGYEEMSRFDVGFAPQSVATSADGTRVYVHNFMSRSVGIFDATSLMEGTADNVTLTSTVSAVASETLTANVLQGKKLFYDARDPRLALESYMACASCHNDGGQDGRVWDLSSLGEGVRNTISLKGHSGMGQGPLHWTANFDEVQDFENQIRDLAGGTGLMSDPDFAATQDVLGAPKAGLSADLDALAAYVASLSGFEESPYRDADGTLSTEGEQGKVVFQNYNCATCHSGGGFTDSAPGVAHDIGTLTAASGNRLGGPLTGLDSPTLKGLWATAPYLHDGSAATVRDAVLAHDVSVIGGAPIPSGELDQLVSYLNQIDDREVIVTPTNWINEDIGQVAAAGSMSESGGVYTVNASGKDIWGSRDEFHFVHQTMTGDGQVVMRVNSLVNTHAWAKAGAMMRESLDDNAPMALMAVTPGNGAALHYRTNTGSSARSAGSADGVTTAPTWLRLERIGDEFYGYKSSNGVNWTLHSSATIVMPQTVYIGMALTSHNDGVVTTATFDNVTVSPANPTPDTTPPTVPTGVATLATGTTSIDVSWNPSSDTETGVAGYNIYRDGSPVGTTGALSFSDTGLAPGTSYLYTVSAFDAASPANHSAQSSPAVNGTTDSETFVNVPPVVDTPQASAESAITSAGLVVGNVTQTNSSSIAAGNVISQNPTAGSSVLAGSAVDLVVSLGAAPVNVPNVVSQSLATATSTLSSNGLVVGTVTRVYDAAPVDEVLSQNPTAGTSVPDGSAVDLTVSDGPAPADTTPPTVPQNLSATAVSANRIDLAWDPSTDTESGVAGYRIRQGGVEIATTAGTSFSVNGLQPSTTYGFTVSAYDSSPAANESAQSSQASDTTHAAPSWTNQDIGQVAAAGSMVESGGVFTIDASGKDIWGSRDEFHFVHQSMTGDGVIVARVSSLVNTHQWAKAGLMMRANLNDNAQMALMAVTPENGAALHYRLSTNGSARSAGSADGVTTAPTWLRLERVGDEFYGSISSDGINWTLHNSATIAMPGTVYVGLALTSHNDGVITTANFDNVALNPSSPPPADTTPPTVPTGLAALAAGTTSIDLDWDASTDAESGIGGYRIYRDSVEIATTTSLSYTDTGLSPGTSYDYTVSAFDNASPANESAESSIVTGTTDAEVYVNVPDVIGQPQASAESAITAEGLVVGNVTQSNDPSIPAGSVISTNPAPFASVLEGSAVDMVVSLGPAPVNVPGVVGQSLGSATATLNMEGLIVGTVTRVYDAVAPLDEVLDQDPAAGVLVPNGSAVNLTVSDGPPPADTTPPTVPQNLVATAAGPNRINLSWDASTDASGVAAYRVLQDGVDIGTTGGTSFAALGLTSNTSYSFNVTAIDASPAANESGQSNTAQATTDLESAWTSQDIGAVAAAGSHVEAGGVHTVDASGRDIWSSSDEFHFVHQTMTGDGEIVLRVNSLVNTHAWAKAGAMMRSTLAANSPMALMAVTPGNGAALHYRASFSGSAQTGATADGVTTAPTWLRIERIGDDFFGYKSADGVNWTLHASVTIAMPATIYVGMALTSHNDGVITTAEFDNVSISTSP